MNRIVRHVLFPTIAPASIVGLYVTPVEAIGCANRGLAAVGVALASALGAFAAVAVGGKLKLAGRFGGDWWLLTAAILTLPLALLLGPLG